jgi:hypothetical protein
VDAHHAPDCTADLVFADMSPYLSDQVQDPNYQDLMDYREEMFSFYYSYRDSFYDGLEPYPLFEFGTLVERRNCSSISPSQQDRITSGIRPMKTGIRLACEEDRQRTGPPIGECQIPYGHALGCPPKLDKPSFAYN